MGIPKTLPGQLQGPLEGKVRRDRTVYMTKLKHKKPTYYIMIQFKNRLTTTPDEYKNLPYWETFHLTRNLFYTDLNIKKIAMIQIKPYTSTEKTILLHER